MPGQSGPPDWWVGAAPFDDPRWAGSYGYGYGAGNPSLGAEVDFSALAEVEGSSKDLLLRWRVRGDTGPASSGDDVWVGFYSPAGPGAAIVLKLERLALTTTSAGMVGQSVMAVAAFGRAGTSGGWSSVAVPSAVTADARLDASCDTSALPVTCADWTIRLRVPTTAAAGGVDLGDTFRMWFEVDVNHADVSPTGYANWPLGAATVDPTALPLTFPEPLGSTAPASSPWFTVGLTAATCAPGIALAAGDVTVTNALGTGTTIDLASPNTFHVRPLNQTQTAYAAGAIEARLRIADWRAGVGDSPLWLPVPDASCAAASAAGSAIVQNGGRFNLTCSWTPTASQACDYRPNLAPGCTPDAIGARYAQQCILAELFSAAVAVPFASAGACGSFSFGSSATGP